MNESVALLRALVAALAPIALATLRLAPATLTLPLFGGRALPAVSRTPLLAVLAIGAAPSLLEPRAPAALSAALLVAALRELWIGLLLAIILTTPFWAVEHAGRLIDQGRGASASELTSLEGSGRGSPLSELFRWSFGAVFVASGGLRAVVLAVASSFVRHPVELAPSALPSLERALLEAVRFSSDALSAGLAVGSAALLALVAAESVVAIASRVAPALAQSQLAAPIRTIAPLALLALALRTFNEEAIAIARRSLDGAQRAWGL